MVNTAIYPATAQPPARANLLASWWHTLAIVLIVLALSLLGAKMAPALVQRYGRLFFYAVNTCVEWLLVGMVWFGIRVRGVRLRDLIGGRWKSIAGALLDGVIALGFWIVSGITLNLVGRFVLGIAARGAVQQYAGFLFPQTGMEGIAWAVVALTAGFCEELIFRGYLQKQFQAMTGSAMLGALLQAVVFGAAHGYQGMRLMILIAVYGFLFGLLMIWRKSLRPGIAAHAWQDLLSGWFGRMLQHG